MKTLLSILFLFFATYGYSQSEKLFTVDRELSNSNINQIYQAKDGVIWIATEDGLNRYDGAKFSVYKHKEGNDSSLVDNNVRILFEDSKGNFLIGTQRGLQLYDPSTDLFKEIPILYQTGINMSAHISTILERKNGELLIGTSRACRLFTNIRRNRTSYQRGATAGSQFFHHLSIRRPKRKSMGFYRRKGVIPH